MAFIILSQKKDFISTYKDELFKLYHFPAKYKNQIQQGDVFIYNQGKQGSVKSASIRCYYGTGTIGEIYSKDGGETYFAKLENCKLFSKNVPTKNDDGTYIEQLGYEDVRDRPNWQNSIRKLSTEAYKMIIDMSEGLIDVSKDRDIEILKSLLKEAMDRYYLEDDHSALVDIMNYSLRLSQEYGIIIK